MRIESAQVQLSSSHYASERHVRRETLEAGIIAPGTDREEGMTRLEDEVEFGRNGVEGRSLLDRYLNGRSLEEAESAALDNTTLNRARPVQTVALESLRQALLDGKLSIDLSGGALSVPDSGDVEPIPEDEMKIEMIVSMIERLTGKKVTILSPEEYLQAPEEAAEAPTTGGALPPDSPDSAPAETGPQFSLRYTSHEVHEEQEATLFRAQGVVKTADGQEIAVDVEVGMSRSFRQETTEVVEIGAAVTDPLVVNFNAPAAELTDRTFRFDMNVDGSEDDMRFVTSGSGFLAIDRNGDGAVNDGSELFGPTSGDGFAELAAYDDDGNGFIDEGDAAYDSLSIWTQDGAGNGSLSSLQDKNVGAIYLGRTATPFDLKNETNELHGQVRSTGFFLSENGTAGTVQQVDLVV